MVLKILSSKIREDKAIQDFQIRNEEIKLYLFKKGMIIYVENYMKTTKINKIYLFRIQENCTKLNCISICQQRTSLHE